MSATEWFQARLRTGDKNERKVPVASDAPAKGAAKSAPKPSARTTAERLEATLRKANEAELVPQLRAALMQHGAREWEAIFGTRVPCTVVRGIEEVFDDEQVAHQGLLATHAHPTLGSYRAVVEPIRFNGERGVKREARAPMLGEHTEQVVGGGG